MCVMDKDESKLSDDQLTAGGQEKSLREAKRTHNALVSIVEHDKFILLILSNFIKDKKAREEFYRALENYYSHLKGINEAIYDHPTTHADKTNYSVLEEKLIALLERIKDEIKNLDRQINTLSQEIQQHLILKAELEEKIKSFGSHAFSNLANYDLYHSSNIGKQLTLEEFCALGKIIIDQAINQAGMGKSLRDVLHSILKDYSASAKELSKVDINELSDLLVAHVKVQSGYSDYINQVKEYVHVKKTVEEKEIQLSILSEKKGALVGLVDSMLDRAPSVASRFNSSFIDKLQDSSFGLADYRNSMEVEIGMERRDSIEVITRENISSLPDIFMDKEALKQGIKNYDDPFLDDDLPLRADNIVKSDTDNDLTALVKLKSTPIHYDDPFADEAPEQHVANDDDSNIRRLGR